MILPSLLTPRIRTLLAAAWLLLLIGVPARSEAGIVLVHKTACAAQNDVSSWTCALSASVGAGNVVAVGISGYYSSAGQTITSVVGSACGTYTLPDSTTTHVSAIGIQAYKYCAAGGSETLTVTTSAAVYALVILVHELSGVDTSTTLDKHNITGAESTSVNPGSITTTNAADYLFVWAGNTGGTTWTVGAGYALQETNIANAGYSTMIASSEDQTRSSTGTFGAASTLTQSGSSYNVSGIMAFLPAAGGGGGGTTPNLIPLLGVGGPGQ